MSYSRGGLVDLHLMTEWVIHYVYMLVLRMLFVSVIAFIVWRQLTIMDIVTPCTNG